MSDLPDEIYYKIFSYLFEYKYLVFFQDIKLQILDYPIIYKTLHYNWEINFHFQHKIYCWRLKNNTTNVIINPDDGKGAMTIYEIQFNNSLKDMIIANMIFDSHFNFYTPEFITDNFSKSKKVLENIKIKNE